jgi:hypothetical protein
MHALSGRLGYRGDGHGLVMQLADTGQEVGGNFPVGVKSNPRDMQSDFGARRLEFVHGVLAHQQAAADATDEDRDLIAAVT